MKAFVFGVCAMSLISLGAWFVLTKQLDYSAVSVNTSHKNDAVRLDPGMGHRSGAHE
ncbi:MULTISPECIES: hypothetical protein [Stappiaceae]|uniref:hypothetical protein n=1 Tax=Stappiaceae TaxID=2821832 RepID=UPI00129C0D0C|nr:MULTISPECIES: hypothetical protein [Stappiaceae]